MTILVTGGSAGIGRAVAEHWAALGHDVVINFHANDAAAEQTAEAVAALGAKPHLVKADVGTQEGVGEAAAQA